ncbi:MAG: hypothetical protein RM368_36885 [Nostoc sp. DedSLP03]|uniref:hypothetical protein n=1 Tax=Nostoc sp. DedSLP03 TaxID=3075400 RepID=UPI002AD3798C|nr:MULTISPECIES: hypothetical protein [unclassified Nostoc]MDZ7970443.1 hypothetical protein [Nostoc sp. DedSLP03]MDZ8212571.1 hypothetical protein [Nostoc sp. ChiSLP03a]
MFSDRISWASFHSEGLAEVANSTLAYCSARSHSQRQAVSTSISLPLLNLIKSVPSS